VIFDHQSDKEARQSFREKTKENRKTASKRDGGFYKNET